MAMLRIVVMVIAVVVTTSRSSAIPQSEEHKSRVVDHVSIYELLPQLAVLVTLGWPIFICKKISGARLHRTPSHLMRFHEINIQ